MTSKDEFEKTKDKYIVTSKIRDVEDKLIVDTMLSELMSIPIMGPLIKVGLDDIIEATVKKREKELIDCIIKKRNITSEQVNNVEFIINFSKTLEAVRRLTSNDKVKFFGNLLRNGYLSGQDIGADLFDECFERIHSMSYREIEWLWKYYTFSNQNDNNHEIWYKFKRFLAKDENIEEEIIANIFASLMRTGLVKQLNVMFPDGDRENPYVLTELFVQFAHYVMKD